jgi:hypothetical protein
MHGQFPRNLEENLVNNEQSHRWLKSEEIKTETESTRAGAQDKAIRTNYFKNKILKEETDSKCRLCKHEDTVHHVTSGCPILAKNDYLMRHDRISTHLHYSICKVLGIETTEKWHVRTHAHTHARTPKPACEHEHVKVLCNQEVHRERSYGK